MYVGASASLAWIFGVTDFTGFLIGVEDDRPAWLWPPHSLIGSYKVRISHLWKNVSLNLGRSLELLRTHPEHDWT